MFNRINCVGLLLNSFLNKKYGHIKNVFFTQMYLVFEGNVIIKSKVGAKDRNH